MTPDRWQQIEQLYHSVLRREPTQRAAFLDEACEGDDQLRREVGSLLDRSAADFPEESVLGLTARIPAIGPGHSLLGRQIGPYEILSRLGAGGMGEVYRAKDTKLGREVAIKVLSKAWVGDRAHMARFRREAQLLASLNHPNIATVHGLEESGGSCCLVMELVPGQTLAERLTAGPLGVHEVLSICVQIAEALEAAHQKGITHRDIKPANIKVTPQGRVKVLDFGLAKSFAGDDRDPERPGAATLTAMTAPGMVLGTPAYMSPEQLRGEPLDNRTDIWAFGCVLYELLAGRRPFPGATVAEIIAAVLKTEPDWGALPAETPAQVTGLIRRCLEKSAEGRVQDIADARASLEAALRAPAIRETPASDPVTRSLAVLPFANSSGDPEMEYLSDGLTESIILNLSQLPQLRVMARSAVFRHKGQGEEPQQAGRALGVGAVLTGKVLQRGETLLISAELVDVEGGWQLWGAQYRRKASDIFAMEEDIAKEIAEKLRLKLTPEKEQLLARRYTESPEAYRWYLKGRYFWNKRTIEGMKEALGYFDQAVETDPSYARAHAGLADCISMLAIYGGLDVRQAYTRTKAAQEMALQIDPGLAEAHASRGFRLLLFDWNFREAEDALRHALKLNPAYASAHQWLGFTLGMTQRLDEARAALKIAKQLDPFSASINTTSVWPVYWARLFDEAIEGFRAAAELHPGYWAAHYYLGLSYAHKGDYGQAIPALRHAAEIGDSIWRYPGLGFVYAQAGEPQRAREVLTKLNDIGRHQYVPPIYHAAVYAGLGETDQALEWLERAVHERNWQIALLHVDPLWDSLRHDARMRILQLDSGLPA